MAELSELLFDYLLGHLDEAEVAKVETALLDSPVLRAELSSMQAALEVLPNALGGLAPSPAARARLLGALDAPKVAARAYRGLEEIFDLGSAAVRDVLALLDRKSEWSPSGVPGFSFIHFDGGPKTAGLECGLITLAAGFEFPRHRHLGEEVTLVVRGAYTDLSTGVVYGPGDVSRLAEGTEHAFRVHEEEDLIYAILMKPDAVEIFWPGR